MMHSSYDDIHHSHIDLLIQKMDGRSTTNSHLIFGRSAR